jgi:Asp-tRNA(Asn)/Glu-tRNA(Gln) amidotransferase A subunit family amidase
MDTVGVIAPTVTDAALVLDTIAGPDTRDSTSIMVRLPECCCCLLVLPFPDAD